MNIKVGDKIKFKSEKIRYTVTACDDRFVIATKPYNPQKTYLYTIIDLVKKQRSSDNYYCKFDYDKPEEAAKAIPQLHNGLDIMNSMGKDTLCLSSRRVIDLDIERVDKLKPEKEEGPVFRYYEGLYWNKKRMCLEEKRGLRLLKSKSNLNNNYSDCCMEILEEQGSGGYDSGFGQFKDGYMYRMRITDGYYGEFDWVEVGHHYEEHPSKHKVIKYQIPKFD